MLTLLELCEESERSVCHTLHTKEAAAQLITAAEAARDEQQQEAMTAHMHQIPVTSHVRLKQPGEKI